MLAYDPEGDLIGKYDDFTDIEDELNIDMSITFTYEKNNIKTSRKSCKLIYNDDTLLIKGL